MLEPIRRWCNPRRFKTVLDWGCGVGILQWFLPRFCPRAAVTGIDWDEEAVAWCRANLPGEFMTVSVDSPASPPADPADLVLSHAAFPRLDREGQRAWLGVLGGATASGGYAALALRGELLRPFITDPDVLGDLERNGICDRPDSGETVQTRDYTVDLCEEYFDVLAYVEGGIGSQHDLIVLRKP